MKLDIHAAFVMLFILVTLGAIAGVWAGVRTMRKGRRVAYYRLRQRQVAAGWWTIIFSVAMVGVAFIVRQFGEPVAYRYFPPSPSPSLSPTITLTPTVSLTATMTLTPAESYTPTITLTPFLPKSIESQFKSVVTPDPNAVFSPLIFSLEVDNFKAVNPQTVFQNPVDHIFVTYTYDGMTDGVQWTEIWYWNGQILKYSTGLWDSGTGGFGKEELVLPSENWHPGTYQLIFFVGLEWKVVGEFRLTGEPPAPTSTSTPSLTPTPSLSPTASNTPVPTWTPRPTDTRWPSPTPVR